MNATQTSSTLAESPCATRTASTVAPTVPSSQRQGCAASNPESISPEPASLHQVRPEIPARRLVSMRARPMRLSFGVIVLLIVGYCGFRYLVFSRSWVSTDNAYLTGHIHAISSRVAGTVKEVLVDENRDVTAGTVLARLDTSDLQVRLQQAVAQVAQATAQVQQAEARIAEAKSQVAREQARATKAKNDLNRATTLFEGGSGAISKQELDLAKAEGDAAEAGLQGACSALESATASAAAARALEKVAGANLQEAQLQLSYTDIVAPVAGRIGKKNIEIGNRVQPGQALLALVQPDVWVTANFKETQLANLKPGQLVRIKADAFPGQTFRGTVESLSPASGSQFALLPPDNATGNFTKIVQRVPVKILIDPTSLGIFSGRLVAGMSVVVEVSVHD